MNIILNKTKDDYLFLDSWTNPDGTISVGEYPIYITGASLCCKEPDGFVTATSVKVPNTHHE